jgi:hypothetical protein
MRIEDWVWNSFRHYATEASVVETGCIYYPDVSLPKPVDLSNTFGTGSIGERWHFYRTKSLPRLSPVPFTIQLAS